MQFQFSHGLNANLPLQRVAGKFYITDDTAQLYVDIDEHTRMLLGDIYSVNTLPESPIVHKIYLLNDELWTHNGTAWFCLNSIDKNALVAYVQENLDVAVKEVNQDRLMLFWLGTKAEYDAIETKNENCLYFTTDETESLTFEEIINKTGVIDESSTDDQYPSAKAVFKALQLLTTALSDIESNKVLSITASSTDENYPSARAVYNLFLNTLTGVIHNGNTLSAPNGMVSIATPVIHASTSEPTNDNGKNGDLWVVYEA